MRAPSTAVIADPDPQAPLLLLLLVSSALLDIYSQTAAASSNS